MFLSHHDRRLMLVAVLLLSGVLLRPAHAGDDAQPTGREPVQMLFIHHSCGGQLMAAEGAPDGGRRGSGERCIYVSHPNGGGLRADLEAAGYQVNEASYESFIGEDTDIHHWRAKFAEHMERILRTRRQDELLPDGVTNRIVAFKSCYPNNAFVGPGAEPGDPDASELTVANAKAAYRSLLPLFAQQPDVLFIAFTAPPQAEPKPEGFKGRLKSAFGDKPKTADWAREFNTWLADSQAGWLAGYGLSNVVVFDYYDILTDGGSTNWSAFATGDGRDSHPSAAGNRRAAEAFVPFLAEAVARHDATNP